MNYKLTKTISIVSSLLTTLTISNFAHAEKANNGNLKITKAYVKKHIESAVPEPETLKWKDITVSNDGKSACATVAAKNKYGAYDGYEVVAFGIENNKILSYTYRDCYSLLAQMNYAQSPEGRIQIEKNEKAKKENDRLTEERIANEQKDSQLKMERAKKQDEEDAAKYLAESDRRDKESEKKYQENKAQEEADLQIAIEKSKAEAEEHNRKTNEKVARDEAEQQRVIDKDKVKGLIPKKLFDLLPK